MRLLLAVVLCHLWFGTHIHEATAESYAIVAPDVVRPNSDYLVAVTVFDLPPEERQDVELTIRGRSESSGQSIEIRHDTSVRSDTTEIRVCKMAKKESIKTNFKNVLCQLK